MIDAESVVLIAACFVFRCKRLKLVFLLQGRDYLIEETFFLIQLVLPGPDLKSQTVESNLALKVTDFDWLRNS